MKAQPNVMEFFIPPVGAPRWVMVFKAIWQEFVQLVDTQKIFATFQSIPDVTQAELYDSVERGELQNLEYLDQTTKAMTIKGVYRGAYLIDEWAGEIVDAFTTRRPFIDKSGNDLCVLISAPPSDGQLGVAELYWDTRS